MTGNHVGHRIKALRTDREWSQARLAEEIESEQTVISRWESGQVKPSYASIRRLAQTFRCSTDWLLGLED